MTFSVRKLEASGGVEVSVTHGPVRVAVIEDPGHLRHFWGELGHLLEEVERAWHEIPAPRQESGVPGENPGLDLGAAGRSGL